MRHTIAVIPGDGIGKEVVPEGVRVLDAAGRRFGFDVEWKWFDWSCERFTKTGRMMPENGLDQLRFADITYRLDYNGVDNWNYPLRGFKSVNYLIVRKGLEGFDWQPLSNAEQTQINRADPRDEQRHPDEVQCREQRPEPMNVP